MSMIVLKLFAGIEIEGHELPLSGRTVQRHRLALLAMLAAAQPRALSRDKLIAHLWPDSDAAHARNLLNQAVHALRQLLGKDAIISHSDSLTLSPEQVASDVRQFEDAVAAGHRDRAVELYAGPFLDGFFLGGCPEFERWTDGERDRLRRSYLKALQGLAEEASAQGDRQAAVEWWQRLAAEEPSSAQVTVGLMQALETYGDRATAIRLAQTHAAALREEFDAEPSPEVVALAGRLRNEPGRRTVTVAPAADIRPVSTHPPPSNEHDIGETKTAVRPLRPTRAAAVVIVIVVVAAFGAAMMRNGPFTIATSNVVQVTSEPGLEFQPAISPDGNEVAYLVGPIGSSRVAIRSTINISSGGEVRAGEGIPGSHTYPNWTPDGASIRFNVCDPFPQCVWREVGKLGGTGTPISVPSDLFSTHGWSPDGTRVAFSRRDSIFAYSTGDTVPQLLGIHTVDPGSPHSFAWSPGGQLLAYVNGNQSWRYSGNLSPSSIWLIDANGGEPVAITSEEHMNLSPQWLPDGRHILFVSNRDGPRGIYMVEVGPDGPLGAVQSVASSSDPHSISLSSDGKKLAYSKFQLNQNIWSIPIPRSEVLSIKDAQPVTTGNQVIETHDLSPDGRFVTYDGSRLGNADIYRISLEGGTAQLIADLPGDAFSPAWSPDGTEIAFHGHGATPGTRSAIFVVSANGGDPRLIADFPGFDKDPVWSPDGLDIAFRSRGPRKNDPRAIWIVSRESVGDAWGDPVRLTDFLCLRPDWAPDGESLVCEAGSFFPGEPDTQGLVIVSKTGEVVTRFDSQMGPFEPHFSPDGSEVYFLVFGPAPGVWSFPVTGGEATQLVAFDDPSLSVYEVLTVGPDRFYLSISEYESDIYVMDLEY